LWSNAQPVTIAGVETLILAPEDQLLHLCLHLERHMRNTGAVSFKWYCDIAAVIQHYRTEIVWTHLVQQSQKHGIEAPVYQGLFTVANYFGTSVPANVLEELKTDNIDEDFFNFGSWALTGNNSRKKTRRKEFDYLTILKEVEGMGHKARILFRCAFPCKEYMVRYYPFRNTKFRYGYYRRSLGTVVHWGLTGLQRYFGHFFKSKSKKG
jgi:hypothetical protein